MELFAFAQSHFGGMVKWVKTIASEPSGNGSSSRVALLTVTVTVCGLLIAFFRYHAQIPSPETLYGLAALITAAAGVYAANKFGKKDDGDPPGGAA